MRTVEKATAGCVAVNINDSKQTCHFDPDLSYTRVSTNLIKQISRRFQEGF